MNDVNPRREYHSERRDRQARATRDAIVAAARKLFVENGYAKTSVRAIAEAAGVSDQTIYAAFGTKRALLTAVWDALDIDVGVAELRAALQQARGDPGRQIDLIVDFDLQLFERAGDVIEAARAAGSSDPELGAVLHEGRERGKRGRAMVMREWKQAGYLREDLSLDEAIDIFMLMCTPDQYNFILKEAGWSFERYQSWLKQAIRELILVDALQ